MEKSSGKVKCHPTRLTERSLFKPLQRRSFNSCHSTVPSIEILFQRFHSVGFRVWFYTDFWLSIHASPGQQICLCQKCLNHYSFHLNILVFIRTAQPTHCGILVRWRFKSKHGNCVKARKRHVVIPTLIAHVSPRQEICLCQKCVVVGSGWWSLLVVGSRW